MPEQSRLVRAAQRFRSQLLVREREAAAEMARAYAPAHQAIKLQLAKITARIEDALANGQELGPSWLFQQGRAEALMTQIEQQMARFSGPAAALAGQQQRRMVEAGLRDSRELASLAAGLSDPRVGTSWQTLPSSAVEDLVGFAADGSPLKDLFDRLGPQVGRAVQDELVAGLALGRNPTKIARFVVERSGLGLARALTISRTEVLRSYRESSRRSYQANPDVVTGWLWLSARQANTCAACWAMDGKRFPTDEMLKQHPNCRCTMVPDTGGTDIGNGPDIFARLDAKTQRRILGPSKHDAYRSGDIKLDDLAAIRKSADWGESVQVASLQAARESAAARAAQRMTPKKALDYYHSPKAFELNAALRQGKELTAEQEAVVEQLDSMFAPIAERLTFHRGVSDFREVFEVDSLDELRAMARKKPGQPLPTFTLRGYTSTSADSEVARIFAEDVGGDHPLLMRIEAPKGTPMLHVPEAGFGEQEEWLLPRDTRLVLFGVDVSGETPVLNARVRLR